MVYTTDAQNLFQMRISAIIDEEEVEIWTNLRVILGMEIEFPFWVSSKIQQIKKKKKFHRKVQRNFNTKFFLGIDLKQIIYLLQKKLKSRPKKN